jgi:hypothetical protein
MVRMKSQELDSNSVSVRPWHVLSNQGAQGAQAPAPSWLATPGLLLSFSDSGWQGKGLKGLKGLMLFARAPGCPRRGAVLAAKRCNEKRRGHRHHRGKNGEKARSLLLLFGDDEGAASSVAGFSMRRCRKPSLNSERTGRGRPRGHGSSKKTECHVFNLLNS